MTYLDLMTKCLKFFKNQKEEFDRYNFYYYWLANDDSDVDSYYKNRIKLVLMYLTLIENKKSINIDSRLFELIEKELSYFDISLFKTIEKVEEDIIEDPYIQDELSLLDQDLLTEEEHHELLKKCFSKFEEKILDGWETQQYESPIHTIIEMVSQIIPELFFTKKGYMYIDKEYQIEDSEFRKKCYQYLKDNIKYYNDNRIYKVDENLYDELYADDEDEYDEDEYDYEENNIDFFLDPDELRGEIDIYGEDIDNLDILYYSVTLLSIMLRYVRDKQYNKINKIIEIDDIMTNSYNGYSLNYEKPLIETLYQPKTMDNDYHREISLPEKSNSYLEFFLSNNPFTEQYNTKQLSLIISCCFDFFDEESIQKLIDNSNTIEKVFETTDINNERENMKKQMQFSRI